MLINFQKSFSLFLVNFSVFFFDSPHHQAFLEISACLSFMLFFVMYELIIQGAFSMGNN